jgi:hypothetical protein
MFLEPFEHIRIDADGDSLLADEGRHAFGVLPEFLS